MYRLHAFFTQNSLKPLYVLQELGVEYEFCFIDLAQGVNRSEAFLEMNPIGKVPVLEHEGDFLFESGAICRYVASVEKSPLYPADKMQRARVDQWMTYWTCHPGRWLTSIFFEKVVKPVAGMGETNPAAVKEAEHFLAQQLGVLDGWLEDRDWLANDAFSIAEPFALAYLEQVHAIAYSLDDYPQVQTWFDRMEARDATKRVRAMVEPHRQAFLGG